VRRFVNIGVVAWVLAAGLWGWAAMAAEADYSPTDACVNHAEMTLPDYVRSAQDKDYGVGKVEKVLPRGAYRTLVPKGLKIENGPVEYFVAAWISRNGPLPDDTFNQGNFKQGYNFTSPCRVQDPSGRWWAVYRIGTLEYVRLEDLMTETDFYRPDDKDNGGGRDARSMRLPPDTCAYAQRPLSDLMAISNDIRAWGADDFRKVPRGLVLENGAKAYLAARTTGKKVLPNTGAWPIVNLREGARIASPCRVKDEDGKWWAALADRQGFLVYVPLDDLLPADKDRPRR
jgi:hypothetical protein